MEFESFLMYLKDVKRYSSLTLIAYRNDLTQFTEFCEKFESIHEWTEVTSKVIRNFEIGLMSGVWKAGRGRKYVFKPMSPSSVRRKLSVLRAFFRYQIREGIFSTNPMESIVTPKMRKRLPVFVPDFQLNEMLDQNQWDVNDFSFFRDMMFLMTAYCTGMRRSELVALTLNDMDLDAARIKITGKGDKQRIIPLVDDLIDCIQEYLKQRERIVQGDHQSFFVTDAGNPVNEKYIYRHIKRCLSKLEGLPKCSPHVLRHSFATVLLNNGACSEAIRRLLGHSSLAATQIYAHNSFENLKRFYNQAHPRA